MNLCSDGHGEVCYDDRTCPACSAIADKDYDISSLEARIVELERQVEELESAE